jgi:hypothetical protein
MTGARRRMLTPEQKGEVVASLPAKSRHRRRSAGSTLAALLAERGAMFSC